MLKLELDWAGSKLPEFEVVSGEFDDAVITVEPGQEVGPAGWPTIKVFVTVKPDRPAYLASMALVGWLTDEYTGGDEDEAGELAELADEI